MADAPKIITLLDSLTGEWLKLPMAAMREVGPAVQTLAGLLKLTNKETFSPVKAIASKSRLPATTVRKHLTTLTAHGWITNAGREHTRRGAPRRTCTIRLTKKTHDALGDYAVLPWWFASGYGWAERALLAVLMARLMALKAEAARQDEGENDILGGIDNLGGDDRFRFSLNRLKEITGLSRPAIVSAKHGLQQHGIVLWQSDIRDDGGSATDFIIPSRTFTVVVTPLENGRCRTRFDPGKKVGNTG
jgi:hypothetical protein